MKRTLLAGLAALMFLSATGCVYSRRPNYYGNRHHDNHHRDGYRHNDGDRDDRGRYR